LDDPADKVYVKMPATNFLCIKAHSNFSRTYCNYIFAMDTHQQVHVVRVCFN